MSDALQVHEALDVVDPEDPLYLGQIYVLGVWHRRMQDLSGTACGVPVHHHSVVPRPDYLTFVGGDLCRECFTAHERRCAARNDANAKAAEEEAQKKRDSADELRKSLRIKRPTEEGDK